MSNRSLPALRLLTGAALLLLAATPAFAQRRSSSEAWSRDCDRRGDRDSERFCMTSESTMASPAGTLVVDGRRNGGISIFGSSRRDVLITARIQASARSEARAEEIARAIRIRTVDGRIFAEGPETGSREWWSVNFEVDVPARSDLDLRAANGGIEVVDVRGVLRLETTNGGIHLEGVAGDVVAETTNGGVDVRLVGERWEGKGLEAITSNGGVRVRIPDGYSAHLETGTVNGGIDIDFPVTVGGRIGRQVTTELGQGGATIRVMTTNGGVVIRRSE